MTAIPGVVIRRRTKTVLIIPNFEWWAPTTFVRTIFVVVFLSARMLLELCAVRSVTGVMLTGTCRV